MACLACFELFAAASSVTLALGPVLHWLAVPSYCYHGANDLDVLVDYQPVMSQVGKTFRFTMIVAQMHHAEHAITASTAV